MPTDFTFRSLARPRIGDHLIEKGVKDLEDKIKRNGSSSARYNFTNQLEALRVRLKGRTKKKESFEEATDVVGRERLLLQLYIDPKSDDSWLPPFDRDIAESILGKDGSSWPSFRRGLAAQLFFTRFSRLPARDILGARLREAFSRNDTCISPTDSAWHQIAKILFVSDGPERVAASALEGENLADVLSRTHLDSIPDSADYRKRINDAFLLERLTRAPLGEGEDILKQFIQEDPSRNGRRIRDSMYEGGISLGAAALRIMTRRALKDGGEWKGVWPDWILQLGSDPALPPASDAFMQSWGCWLPTPHELACAQRALNRQTLEYFIQFLDESLRGTDGYHMYEQRAYFLRRLDDTQKIQRFRLILNESAFRSLPKEYRKQAHRVARHNGSNQQASLIVMECCDEVWIVEGTHSYALRAFHRVMPLKEIFDVDADNEYKFSSFTQGLMHRDTCPGIFKQHMGNWLYGETGLMQLMRSYFRLEWSV